MSTDLLANEAVSDNRCSVGYPNRILIRTSFDESNGLVFPPRPIGGWPKHTSRNGKTQLLHIGERLYRNSQPETVERRAGLGACWTWQGARTNKGGMHGQIMCRAYAPTPQRVHRIAWQLHFGPIPFGKQINHHCDNGLCVRPDHLYLGTQAQNMRDAAERGRLLGRRRAHRREAA